VTNVASGHNVVVTVGQSAASEGGTLSVEGHGDLPTVLDESGQPALLDAVVGVGTGVVSGTVGAAAGVVGAVTQTAGSTVNQVASTAGSTVNQVTSTAGSVVHQTTHTVTGVVHSLGGLLF
jgi:hypothetical protein